jgi:hypothetical protein
VALYEQAIQKKIEKRTTRFLPARQSPNKMEVRS